ncbi:hypothetical protein EJB05_01071, partial [Eragrostis curvula]
MSSMVPCPEQQPPPPAGRYNTDALLPPPVDHRSAAGIREGRRLPASCVHDGSALHSRDALRDALQDRICGHYVAAFKLLPVAVHTGLIACLDKPGGAGGLCLGLLEPRSNIVVNALIDYRRRRRMRRRKPAAIGEDVSWRAFGEKKRWLEPARLSANGLITFLCYYFRYLSSRQAMSYLYLADADLVIAMGLVETDLANSSGSRGYFTFHSPCRERTFDALHLAAKDAHHPDPYQVAVLSHRLFNAAQAGRFQPNLGKHPISADSLPDVLAFLLRKRISRPLDDDYYYEEEEEEDSVNEEARPSNITVYDLRRRKVGTDRIVLSPPPPLLRQVPKKQHTAAEDHPCEYEATLTKLLVDNIQFSYIQAFARLSDPAVLGALHIPIVRSGFTFGPLDDPVDNILINAIWFKTAFPSQSPPAPNQRVVYNQRLALLSMRSLDAAIAYLCARFDTLSHHDAVLLLHSAGGCNLKRADELALLAGHAPCSDDRAVAIRVAVEATGHSDGEQLATFIHSLNDAAKARILTHLQQPQPLTIADLHDIATVLDMHFSFPLEYDEFLPDEKPADRLLSIKHQILAKRMAGDFEGDQLHIMTKLNMMLDSNKKEILCVFGGESSWYGEESRFFHVNFLARDVNEAHWSLFFAQILDTSLEEHGTKSFFSPLLQSEGLNTSISRMAGTDVSPMALSAGRCLTCEWTMERIFHPNSDKYIARSDESFIYKLEVLCGDALRVDETGLKSDYIYFNDRKDIRLIQQLNSMVDEGLFPELEVANFEY